MLEDVNKKKYLCTLGGNVNWCIHYEKYGEFFKKLKTELCFFRFQNHCGGSLQL